MLHPVELKKSFNAEMFRFSSVVVARALRRLPSCFNMTCTLLIHTISKLKLGVLRNTIEGFIQDPVR